MAKFKVYYSKPQFFRIFCGLGDAVPNAAELVETHVHLCTLEADSLDDVFSKMQGENWSPNGESRALLEEKQLMHTSMSIGDVAEDMDTGKKFACAFVGWKEI